MLATPASAPTTPALPPAHQSPNHPGAVCEAAPAPPAKPTKKPRGNPNLALAPRCGAKTRAGCPCQAPAIHGKRRCRMHGGRSTGPRTAQGLARLRAARTIHGHYGAEIRARARHSLTTLRRGRVHMDAIRYADRLPPDLATRLHLMPPGLSLPPYPTGGLTPAQDRAARQAEVEALAPWKQAIALIPGRRPPRRFELAAAAP